MKSFVEMSKYAGMREDIVQAGGGNSSFKLDSNTMFIKASGFQLADVTEEEGYAVVNPLIIKEEFMNSDLDSMTEEYSKDILNKAFLKGNRPSIETFLHSVSGNYTLHTHPVVVNALTSRSDGEDILNRLFPESLIVPYATPGVELAKTYFKTYKKKYGGMDSTVDTVFLLNHGMVVSDECGEKVIKKTENILRTIENYLGVDYNAYHESTYLWNFFKGKVVWKVNDHNILNIFEKMGSIWNFAFCPDCVVFLGKKIMILPEDFTEKDIQMFEMENGNPAVVLYSGNLYIIADSVKKAMDTQSVLSFSAQVMFLNRTRKCHYLSEEEQNFLLNWEAEKYRRSK